MASFSAGAAISVAPVAAASTQESGAVGRASAVCRPSVNFAFAAASSRSGCVAKMPRGRWPKNDRKGSIRVLLDRIRAIRASEKRFYLKIRDLFATAADYDRKAETARLFFQTIQNKMLWAVTGHTAAELIVARADSGKANMGLTAWSGGRVRKADIDVAKNYLAEAEARELDRLVAQHNKDESKEFWDRACIVTSKDQNLTKAHDRHRPARAVLVVELGDDAFRALAVGIFDVDVADDSRLFRQNLAFTSLEHLAAFDCRQGAIAMRGRRRPFPRRRGRSARAWSSWRVPSGRAGRTAP